MVRACLEPGCPELVERGRCQRHQKPRRDNRPSPSRRGYDWDWIKLRREFASKNPPMCARCGISREDKAMHVDHIEPFESLDDPKRLDKANLQWLCKPHHDGKTRRDRL